MSEFDSLARDLEVGGSEWTSEAEHRLLAKDIAAAVRRMKEQKVSTATAVATFACQTLFHLRCTLVPPTLNCSAVSVQVCV